LVFWNDVLDSAARQSCEMAASPAVVMESRACVRLALWRSERFGVNNFLRNTETESCFRRAFDD